ncbi:MAG: sigma-70 family RNA polymerase sigma factor [Alphaproteobacteria bacterium]|nr:sigma-70 family RNA polymerase sigma factor [Alphaproteobacteria bacterium]
MVTELNKYGEFAELLRRANDGDKACYQRFLEGIAPLLRRQIAARIPVADVEDVLQEVLISVHKARHTYDGERPIMPWLASITQFRMIDYLRKHYIAMRHQTTDITEVEDILADVTQTPASSESIDELLIDVPEKQKRILTLMHVEGFTAKQVGQKLNMSETAVKVAAHRAMKKIRIQKMRTEQRKVQSQ